MRYLYAAAAALILVFISLILRKKGKVLADYYLIGINILVGCFMLSDVLVQKHLSSGTVIFQNGVPLLLFPVFTLYVLQFLNSGQALARKWLLLFLPALLFGLLSFWDHYVGNNYSTEAQLVEHFNNPSLAYHIIFKGAQISFIAVLVGLIRRLYGFEKALKLGFSTDDLIDLRWLIHFTWIYLISLCITFVLFLGQNLGVFPFQIQEVFGMVYGLLVASVFYLNYQGIQHYTLAQVYHSVATLDSGQHLVSKDLIEANEVDAVKALTEEELALEAKILAIIASEKLYLEPKFSLEDLASLLGENRHRVSKVINAQGDRTFYDLINGYRVAHLKQLLDDSRNDQFTILAMGLDSGFNSKASLNRIFKSITGITPKLYLENRVHSATRQ